METIRQFMNLDERRHSLGTAIAAVNELGLYLENGQAVLGRLIALERGLHATWAENTLASMGDLMDITSQVDARLIGVNRDLIRAIADHPGLLAWMRDVLRNDFQQAVEIVSGLGEAQCPDDLWEDRDRKLGALSEVRQQLQNFIFRRTEKFETLSELTDVLVNVPDGVIEHIVTCNALLVPFSLAFSNDPDSVAPRRLAMFHDEERRACWSIGWTVDHPQPTISVEYKVRRHRRDRDGNDAFDYTHTKRLQLHELEDFQSSLVLVQTVGTLDEQAMIETFLRQYHLALRVLDAMVHLRDGGHFDYQSASCEAVYSLNGGTDELHADLHMRENELKSWENDLDRARRQYYALNNLTLRQLWAMVKMLSSQGQVFTNVDQTVADFRANFEIVLPDNGLNIPDILAHGPPWLEREELSLTSGERLDKCGVWLNKLVMPLKLRRRQLSAAADPPPGSSAVRPGLNLTVCANNSSPFHVALSLYAMGGWLPEREELLFCTAETTWELIRNFLYRWELAGDNERGDRLFVLCGMDSMPFSIQNRVAQILRFAERRRGQGVCASLVVVVRSEVGHIVSELSPYRVTLLPLAREQLSAALSEVAVNGSGGITVLTGQYAGTGKSFWMRSEATKRSHHVVRVPIHAETPSADIIAQLRRGFDDVMSGAITQTHGGRASMRAFQMMSSPVPGDASFARQPQTYEQYEDQLRSKGLGTEIDPETLKIILDSADEGDALLEDSKAGASEMFITYRQDGAAPEYDIWRHYTDWNHQDLFVNVVRHFLSYDDPREVAVDFAAAVEAEVASHVDESSGLTCHINITRRVGPIVEATLFEVLVFGSLVDPHSGEYFLWDRASTAWAVEVASDVSVRDLQFLALLPQERIIVTPESFCIHDADLFLGMGSDFESSRFDGSSPHSVGSCFANAAVRVQRVSKRLKHIYDVNLNNDRVVGDQDEADTLTTNVEAFELLVRASRQNEASPSLTAIWAFVNVMFWQLWDLDDSDSPASSAAMILDSEEPGRGRWFKLKLSELIVHTARDFAPRCPVIAANMEDIDPHQRGLAQVDGLVKWKESNHQCILFQRDSGGVSFLAVDYVQMERSFGAALKDMFAMQGFNLRPSEEEIVALAPSIFSAISGVFRTAEAAATLLQGGYVMTNDNLLKMVAVFVRVRCGAPVVLMGECGCGKSLLMKFICTFLNVRLLTLDVHGGTTKDDVYNIFAEAEAACQVTDGTVWVFLDEVNTSSEIGLLTEAIVHRTLNGRALHRAIQVVGAVNPYRRKPARDGEDAGLRLNQHAGGRTNDALANDVLDDLVYRVYPLPASLLATVFDFGYLDNEIEAMYIRTMVERQFPRIHRCEADLLARLIHRSQGFVREFEQESSAVSLRDVKRALSLISWFRGPGNNHDHRGLPVVKPVTKRVLNHTQFAAEHELEWPCPQAYAEYVANVIETGIQVELLEDVDASITIGATGVVRSLNGMHDPPTATASVTFPSGGLPVEALLPLHSLHVQKEDDKHREGPSDAESLDFRSTALSLAHVYFYRLNDDGVRMDYFREVSGGAVGWDREAEAHNLGDEPRAFGKLCADRAAYAQVIDAEQRLYADNMLIDEGIARNQALRENIFVEIVSMCNRIPVFVVGRPGTSKSLSLRLIASNLLGEHSPSEFFRRFPAVHIVPYQCSPHSTADSITFQYEKAVDFASSRGQDSMTVLLLDEVGLAELSPDLPLKVLHKMLIDPPIAIVGISNWVLDPAKMNRACILQRSDPGEDELLRTAKAIAGTAEDDDWLESLSMAFHEIYTNQGGRPWIGMRDFYSLIKALRRAPRPVGSSRVEWHTFFTALCRNFGGKPDVLRRVLTIFRQRLKLSHAPMSLTPALTLIRENLADADARHLMVLTVHGAAMQLLFQCGVIELGERTRVLIGSSFSSDASEYHLISQINSIKRAMQIGQRVVLLNCDALYEALYDVLNQAFVTRMMGDVEQKFLRLAVGKRSQLCPVHPEFRLIAVTEREHAYNNLDLPLLNRLEKQLLRHSDVCDEQRLSYVVDGMKAFMSKVLQECGTATDAQGVGHYFPGYHESTVASLVLAEAERLEQLTLQAQVDFDAESFRTELLQKGTDNAMQVLVPAIKSCDVLPKLSIVESMIRGGTWTLSPQDKTAIDDIYFEKRAALSHDTLRAACCETLARCATPLAILKSGSLRKSCQHHFENPNTGDVVRVQMYESLDRYLNSKLSITAEGAPRTVHKGYCACTFSVLTTRSPSAHLETALTTFDDKNRGGESIVPLKRLQLADFESEKSFETEVKAYFEWETTDETLLIVQCDPLLTPPALIDHARYICRDRGERSKRRDLFSLSADFRNVVTSEAVMSNPTYASHVQKGYAPQFPRHVVFVLHVPLGIARRSREFPLTFDSDWQRLFIDDLLIEDADCTTVKILNASVVELASASTEFNAERYIAHNFMGALAIVMHPQLPFNAENYNACLFPQRIATFRELMHDREFLNLLVCDTHEILEEFCHENYSDGLHAHVQIAMGDGVPLGTLRQSLLSAVRKVMNAAVANAIARVDRNFNLRVLQGGRVPRALWFAMAEARKQTRSSMGGAGDNTFTVNVQNDGLHGPFCCQFPFSFSVINFLENERKKAAIKELGMAQASQRLDALLGLTKAFHDASRLIHELFSVDRETAFNAYLADFIEQAAPAFSCLSSQHQAIVYAAVLSEQNAAASPGGFHAAVGCQEDRLFLFCSVLDILSARRQDLLADVLERFGQLRAQPEKFPHAQGSLMAPLEHIVIGYVVEFLAREAASGNYGAQAKRREPLRQDLEVWCQLVSQLRSHFQTFWTRLITASDGQAIHRNEKRILTSWIRVETYCLIASEVMLPALLLREKDEIVRRDHDRRIRVADLQSRIQRARFELQRQEQRGQWYKYMPGYRSTEDCAKEVTKLEGELSRVLSSAPVNSRVVPVIMKLARVLQNVNEMPPFEADSIFLHVANMTRGLRDLMPRQAEFRCVLVQRFVHRFFVELVCRMPQDAWPDSLVTAMVDLAFGTSDRLTAGVVTPSLQKALLHRVFGDDSKHRFRFLERTVASATRMSLETRHLLVHFFQDKFQWLRHETASKFTCDSCWEDRSAVEMCRSTCGHATCARCLEMNNDAFGVCHQCRNSTPVFQGSLFLKNTSKILSLDDSTVEESGGNMLIGKLAATGLARLVVHTHALEIMRVADNGVDTVFDVEAVDGRFAKVAADFVVTAENREISDYCLAVIRRRGGSNYLLNLIRNANHLIPWFKPQMSIVTIESVKLPFDPFLGVVDEHTLAIYSNAVLSIPPSIVAGHVNMDEVKALSMTVTSDMMIPILFSSVHCTVAQTLERNLPKAAITAFTSFDMQGVSVFARGLTSNFENIPLPSAREVLVCDPRGGEQAVVSSLLRVQVLTHIVRLAQSMPRSWYGALLCDNLDLQRESFMPSMAEDEFSMILQAVERGGGEAYADLNRRNGGLNGSTWYMCAAGHPYSVGECGMNITNARCTCGARIGGSNHTTRGDNKQLTLQDLQRRQAGDGGKGYMQSTVSGKGCDSLQRPTSALAIRILRLIMHGLLMIRGLEAMGLEDATRCDDLADFVFERSRDVKRAVDFLAETFMQDWCALQEHLSLSEENVVLFLHVVMRETWRQGTRRECLLERRYDTSRKRSQDEQFWERQCVAPFLDGTAGHLDDARQDFQLKEGLGGVEWHLRKATGEDLYRTITGAVDQGHWAYSEPLTLDSFRRAVQNANTDAPGVGTLTKFLEDEEQLKHVQLLPSVLAWHREIFEALGGGISRQEAREMTNGDVLALLPDDVRPRGQEAFDAFKLAWKEIMPRLEFLYECTRNPYRDVSGERMDDGTFKVGEVIMNEETPIMFSLPNIVEGEEGLECTCTIAILGHLQRLHNRMLLELRNARGDRSATQTRAVDSTAANVGYLTAPAVARQKLVVYNRMTDLFPVLVAHSRDDGGGRQYNLELIAKEVELLFEGKEPVSVQIRHFVFNGEVAKLQLLTKLSQVLEQRELDPDIKARLAEEIDTQARCTTTMLFIERCVRFISSLGGGGGGVGLDPDMTLERFATTVLIVDAAEWTTLRTPSLSDGVTMSTLGSTYRVLEDWTIASTGADAYAKIGEQFKADIPADLLGELRRSMAHMDLPVLLVGFRFLIDQMKNNASFQPEHPITLWLGEAPVDHNTQIVDLGWFEAYFPSGLLCQHAVATYRTLLGDE